MFYFAEVESAGSHRQAEALKAETLSDAKKEASRRQAFYGTVLFIGTGIDAQGFITEPIAVKEGGKWQDVE